MTKIKQKANKTLFPTNDGKSEEVNFKKNFCEKYFDKGTWSLDVLKQVDVLLQDRKGRYILYIESKHHIRNRAQRREAIAQVILTNKKQEAILNRVAIIYLNENNDEILELIDCSDDSVMYNNDINWSAEKPSSPTKDAIDRINDRIKGKIKTFKNDEIKEFYETFKKNQETTINITEKNFNVVYNLWKNEVHFKERIDDEQDRINLFLVDLLNGTKYKKSVFTDLVDRTLFDNVKVGEKEVEIDEPLIREGTNLSNYVMMKNGEVIDGIKYSGLHRSSYYTIVNIDEYFSFWNRYKRPPEKHEFMNILERSSTLYSEKYRKDTGGEYTPTCFVELQNKLLHEHYNLDDYIVCDPCAGVGNLENQFGKDYKQYCYLSTLEQMDVDTCIIKGFENAIQFDYLKDDKQPLWKYKGRILSINEIAKLENRKLMVVMNPPYQRRKGFKYDLAIEFFIKVSKLQPDVIVYYCKTEFFLRDTISVFANSGYNIISHVFSNAKETFKISEWPISLIVFDKSKGNPITIEKFTAQRYELNKNSLLEFKNTYTYDNSRPNLIDEIEKEIWNDNDGLILGQWCYLRNVMYISNGGKEKANKITSNNLKWCLLSKGINFNSHDKYFERSYATYRGVVEDINQELLSDAIMFSLFYKQFGFSNKEGHKNYIMPFTAEELGCAKNDLNVLFPEMGDLFDERPNNQPFDFRDYLRQFVFSKEAKTLYLAALEIFKFYHHSDEYSNKDYNDSYYDITNAIMGKDVNTYTAITSEIDTRVTKVKTTKGTKGFGRNTIPYVVASTHIPIFIEFFNARDVLARKINRQLVEQGLLLWERENIY
ncbi:MAG: hypothetical protein IJ886_10395 [Prevotella sp.]|nr:hypothetical protein [Prevotella sp.]MBR2230650.1 hypothetical protein [Prevotella sp.]